MQIIPDPMFALLMALPFAATLLSVYALIVTPLIAYLDGRHHALVGARHHAEKLQHEADRAVAEIAGQLAAARDAAGKVAAEHRQRGQARESEIVGAARDAAEGELSVAIDEVRAESSAARAGLPEQARLLSNDIAGRVLGRSVQA